MADKITNTEAAVDQVWSASPAVARWSRMCHIAAEYLLVSMQAEDALMIESETMRKAIGYLSFPPKRIPRDEFLENGMWERVKYYSAQEARDMTKFFTEFLGRLYEWAMSFDGDEDDFAENGREPVVRSVWLLVKSASPSDIFKVCKGRKMFRRTFFAQLGAVLPRGMLCPQEDFSSLGEMGAPKISDDAFKTGVLTSLREISANTEIPAQEILADQQSRLRVGTDGQIVQENEVIRRVRANGGRGISGFVAQVLREREWQLRSGHSNTDAGRRLCYSRVYEILHPARRKKAKRAGERQV